jgi:hypothetical protein
MSRLASHTASLARQASCISVSHSLVMAGARFPACRQTFARLASTKAASRPAKTKVTVAPDAAASSSKKISTKTPTSSTSKGVRSKSDARATPDTAAEPKKATRPASTKTGPSKSRITPTAKPAVAATQPVKPGSAISQGTARLVSQPPVVQMKTKPTSTTPTTAAASPSPVHPAGSPRQARATVPEMDAGLTQPAAQRSGHVMTRPTAVLPGRQTAVPTPTNAPVNAAALSKTAEYKRASRRWTSVIVALPILIVTSYYLFDRCELEANPSRPSCGFLYTGPRLSTNDSMSTVVSGNLPKSLEAYRLGDQQRKEVQTST